MEYYKVSVTTPDPLETVEVLESYLRQCAVQVYEQCPLHQKKQIEELGMGVDELYMFMKDKVIDNKYISEEYITIEPVRGIARALVTDIYTIQKPIPVKVLGRAIEKAFPY